MRVILEFKDKNTISLFEKIKDKKYKKMFLTKLDDSYILKLKTIEEFAELLDLISNGNFRVSDIFYNSLFEEINVK